MNIYGYNLRYSLGWKDLVLDQCILEKDEGVYYWVYQRQENVKNILSSIHSKVGFLIPKSDAASFLFGESHLKITTENATLEQIEKLYSEELKKWRL